MTGWAEFILALAVFLLSHALPVRPPVRPWLIARLGRRGYSAAYSLLSLAVLAWLISAAARAPYVEVFPPLPVLRWVPLLAMPVVSVLAVAGLAADNPLSFGGLRRRPYDPARPGVLALSRHPLLLALFVWALVHIPPNGGLAHVLLFGLFAGFAWAGMAMIDRRRRRELGDRWGRLASPTARFAPRNAAALLGPVPLLGGGVIFLVLLVLHPILVGVSPLP